MVKEMVLAVIRANQASGGAWPEVIHKKIVEDTVSIESWWDDLPKRRRNNLVSATIEDLITEHRIEFGPGRRSATGRCKLRLVNVLDQMARELS